MSQFRVVKKYNVETGSWEISTLDVNGEPVGESTFMYTMAQANHEVRKRLKLIQKAEENRVKIQELFNQRRQN